MLSRALVRSARWAPGLSRLSTVRTVSASIWLVKALRWHGREDVRLDEVEFESALGDFDVEVAVACCGICGSDLTEFRRGPLAIRDKPHVLTGQRPPLTLGHEFSGRVVAVGDKVQDAEVG